MFLRVRTDAHNRRTGVIRSLAPDLDAGAVNELATYCIGVDGLFVAIEIASDSIDLGSLFEMHARSILDAAVRLSELARDL